MGTIIKELGRLTYITATTVGTAQSIWTNTTGLDSCVSHIIMHNTNTSAIVVTICKVPGAGGVADTADINDEIWQQSIAASDTEVFDVPLYLTVTGDSVQMYVDVASKVNAIALGLTYPDQS